MIYVQIYFTLQDYITSFHENQRRKPQSAGVSYFRYIKLFCSFGSIFFLTFNRITPSSLILNAASLRRSQCQTAIHPEENVKQEESTATMFKPELDWLLFEL